MASGNLLQEEIILFANHTIFLSEEIPGIPAVQRTILHIATEQKYYYKYIDFVSIIISTGAPRRHVSGFKY